MKQEILEQMEKTLKVLNKEMGELVKETRKVLYILIFNSLLISAIFIKIMFF